MNKSVVIPMHIDGLYLYEEKTVAEPTADFADLPYNNAATDFNYERPYLSESFISRPFQNQNLLLPPGVHLHWALPSALVNGISNEPAPKIFTSQNAIGENGVVFPVVPDRWLIIRRIKEDIDKAWVVESDYMHTAGNPDDNPYNGITYPLINSGNEQPYRYMGRHYSVDNQGNVKPEDLKQPKDSSYFQNLTSVGYGSPVFSAFYPNCHSVFGFYDADVSADMLADLEYDIWGWYSDESKDPIGLLHAFQKESKDLSAKGYAEIILNKLNWKIADPDFECDGMVCGGTINYRDFVARKDELNAEGLAVTIGNTGTEALSALLGSRINRQFGLDNHHTIIEDQLEALQLFAKMAGQELDTDKKMLQAMHEQGFSQVDGGMSWSVNIENALPADTGQQAGTSSAIQPDGGVVFDLPAFMASKIQDLNRIQQSYDRAGDELVSLQQQLFADWYKYMVACYHGDLIEHTADADRIKFLIENDHFKLINNKKQELSGYSIRLSEAMVAINQYIIDFDGGGQEYGNTLLFSAATLAPSFTLSPEPSLSGQYVALFQGQDGATSAAADFFSYVIEPATKVAALSLLVNISAKIPATESYLLRIDNDPTSTVGPRGAGLLWTSIFVDGVKLDPYRPRQWSDIPKDRWVHIYLVARAPMDAREVTLFQGLKGKMAGLKISERLLSEEELFNDRNMLKLKRAQLRSDKAPRFWLPNDPVVLIAGSDVKVGNRHLINQQLNCVCIDLKGVFERNQSLYYNLKKIPAVSKLNGITQSLANTEGNWNPTLLQWEVIVKDSIKLDGPYSNEFAEDFITANYNIKTGDYDLAVINANVLQGERIKFYTGSTILSAHAKTKLQSFMSSYLLTMNADELTTSLGLEKDDLGLVIYSGLVKEIATLKAAAKNQITEAETYNFYNAVFAAFNNLLKAVTSQEAISPFLRHVVAAAMELSTSNYLSQSLGGFNAALLQMHETMQLPVDDPVSFTESQAITALAAKLIGRENKRAPLPLNQFNPIKTGTIRINQLGVIDNFGQVVNMPIRTTDVLFSHSFTAVPQGKEAFLPPRIVQPARLNFRWVSAANSAASQANADACQNAGPVCGWLVPNNLDVSLLVYDADGYILGLIRQNKFAGGRPMAEWASAPGNLILADANQIPNTHLRVIVGKLIGKNNFADFIELLDNTLQQIDPENFAQHLDLAMLVGRPIAVVKASVSLEVKGMPAINQGWDYFNADLGSNSRETNSWENVKFPVLIGEPGILNDGVLGFWDEDESANVFQSVYPENINNGYFVAHQDGAHTFSLSITDKPKTLTLLMDPRGEAHATTGILPAKSISIPVGQFKPALARMNVSFFTRPILMAADGITVSLPEEAGYSWSWLAMEAGKWTEVSTTGIADKALFLKAFAANGEEVWQSMLQAGWIKETAGGKALITSKTQWAAPSPLLLSHLQDIQSLLDAGHIVSMNSQGHFSKDILIREGWLNLSVNK
ncbi:hypothetical protein ACVWYF_003592 [Hymenobacter sp. UYAg731]